MTKHIVSQPALTDKTLRRELKRELSSYPTKADLKRELSSYPTKVDLKRELYAMKTDFKRELSLTRAEIAASEQRLALEFARQANAILDESRRLMSLVDEKYNKVPDPLTKLELAVGIER